MLDKQLPASGKAHRSQPRSAVVLLDANQRAAVSCIRSLSNLYPSVQVFAAMAATGVLHRTFLPYSSHSRSVRVLRYDGTEPARFLSSLVAFVDIAGPYVLFPSGEHLLRWALASKEQLEAAGVTLPMVDLATYEIMSNKLTFAETVASYGIPVPKRYERPPEPWRHPFVIKPKTQRHHAPRVLDAPLLVDSPRAYAALRSFALDMDAHFCQEFVQGPSHYYCALYWRRAKQLSFTQMTLAQQPNGKSVVCAVPAEITPAVVARIDAMMLDLDWSGLMMIELKASADQLLAIECNPRVWGPLQVAIDNGVDFPAGLWRLAVEGEEVTPEPHADDVDTTYGYRWIGGYAQGALAVIAGEGTFQTVRDGVTQVKQVTFRDIWWRRDTVLYGLIEPALMLASTVRSIIAKALRRWATASRRRTPD